MKTLKRTLCLVLVAVMALGLFAVAASAKKLSDYSDAAAVSSDYQVAVDVATQLGILEGMDATTYGAKGTLTRAQLATMLYRMVTGDVAKKYVANYAGGAAFADVKADAWYAGYVNYAADKGLLAGVGNGKYDPNSALTGYQTLAAFLRALGYGKNGEFVGATWTAGVVKYADVIDGDIVADWSKPITREVAAQLIYNTLKAETVSYVFGQYVGTKSTKEALCHNDGKKSTENGHPHRGGGRQYQSQHDSSYHGGQVLDTDRLLGKLLEQHFKNHCGSHRHNQCHQGWNAEYYHTTNTEGQQCNDDKEHDILCVSPGTYVGSWGEINFIYIGWTSHCSSPFRP